MRRMARNNPHSTGSIFDDRTFCVVCNSTCSGKNQIGDNFYCDDDYSRYKELEINKRKNRQLARELKALNVDDSL